MITVVIYINDRVIYTRSARRMESLKKGKKIYKYQVDNGSVIKHNYENGAVCLAKKMLDTITKV